jgi:class 3 adenylate cyclase
MSATPDSTLANPEQRIADLERQLAEREVELAKCKAERDEARRKLNETTTERDEALEQQTATAEVLQIINSSPGDLTPVFDAMLERALRLCGASFGNLLSYNGELFDIVAAVHAEGRIADRQRHRPPFRMVPSSVLQTIVQGAEVGFVEDVRDSGSYRAVGRFREMVDSGGYRSLLNIALRKEGALVGVIGIFRTEVRPFTDKQIALLQNFAAQAEIAMENARLLTETREALEQQTATAEVLQVINSSPGDLAPVFDAMLEKATRLCEAPFGTLRTWDGECFHLGAVHGEPTFRDWVGQRGPIRPDGDASPLGRIQAGERVVRVADEPGDEGYWNSAGFRKWVEASGIRRGIWVALRKDDELLGTITVFRHEPRPFSEKQIALLENFAAQAVIAMENGRLLGELRQRTEEVAELNRGLEARVAEQVDELGRVGRLKRFLAPQLAELIVSQGDEKILESHRRDIVVVFCDLRGYTAFTETAEPEEVLDFLREYHGALGPLVSQFEGTLDQFSGDGIMVFFNDPVPIPDPAERAVKMAVAMREAAGDLIAAWRRRGRELGFGAGIAQGYATLGQIGFTDRSGYTAIGTVCNVAARLCAEARDGQILLSQRVAVAVEGSTTLEEFGALTLKGLTQPVVAYNVPLAATQPALRVIEGGPQTV